MTVLPASPRLFASFRLGRVSFRLAPRLAAANLMLLVILTGLGIWSLGAGDFPIPFGDVVSTLLGQGTAPNTFVVFSLRLPRLIAGILVGVAFGMSGAIFQSLARNPLASPDVIGFDSGAALGAVIMIIGFGATGLQVALGAVLGGLVTAVLVFGLSWHKGVSPLRLVLIGIGLSFTAYAGVDFLMTRSDIFEAAAAQAWLTGSLNARVWSHVQIIGTGIIVLVPLAFWLQTAMDRIELGDDLAAALGIRVDPARVGMALVGVLLASLAVASAGPIVFVAFVAGPLARRISDSPGLTLGTAAMVGAVVTVGGDLAGRLALAPLQLPVGVFTAILGAPYLLWLLARQVRKGAL